MKLSLISPSRNNLKYLRWSYTSVRKNCSPDVEYCVAIDFSNDGTEEWCKKISKKDPNFKYIVQKQTKRWGHTIWYDILIEDVATGDIIMIWHADMYATPKMDERLLSSIKKGQIVSLTRVEPPLHPPGAEKLTADFGTEPEDFDEERFLKYNKEAMVHYRNTKKTGIFAPWAMFREDFLAIGGHDPLFAPQSREDSDIFNRFILAGYESIQLFDTFVYHMTCRGSRFAGLDLDKARAEGGGFVRQTSEEWATHNRRSERNFIRKWGHMVKTDIDLRPVIPPKYNISFLVDYCNLPILHAIEPWCSRVFIIQKSNLRYLSINDYIENEQPNTTFDLTQRIYDSRILNTSTDIDVLISFDGSKLTNKNFQFLTQLSEILTQSGSTGEFIYDIFKIQIFMLKTYEQELIKLKRTDKDEAIESYLNNPNLP